MSGVYRSKSYRRYDDTIPIAKLIERDNTTILATASAQLFISAPKIERWYKSSTGTICLLKNFLAKNSYYFRLYSLMRFNYGFKFVCEDEAEHFFNVVRKFSIQPGPQHHQQTSQSSSSETVEQTSACNVEKTSPQLEAQQMSNNSNNHHPKIRSHHQSRLDTKTTTTTTTTTAAAATPTNNATETHKPRRYANSSDRRGGNRANSSGGSRYLSAKGKKPIDKSDISCPFRCLCADLSDSGASANENNGEVHQRGSTEMIKKYSTVVKELALVQQSIPPKNQTTNHPFVTKDQLDQTITRILTTHNQTSLIGHKRLYKSIGDYINETGGVSKFEHALEMSQSDRNRFSAFLAVSIAMLTQSPNKSAASNINMSALDLSNASTAQSVCSMRQLDLHDLKNNKERCVNEQNNGSTKKSQSPKTPSTMVVQQLQQTYLKSTLKTPTVTPQQHVQVTSTSGSGVYLLTPPKSAIRTTTPYSEQRTSVSKILSHHQQQQQRTMQPGPSNIINTPSTPTIANVTRYSRIFTPSLSPPHKPVAAASSLATLNHSTKQHINHVSRASRAATASSASIGGLGKDQPPPKPPRRTSLKTNR